MADIPLQRWDAAGYARNARFVAEHGLAVLDLLAPRAGECVLDVGCGDGALSREIERLGAAVVGVDSSPELVAVAKTAGLDARLIDAHEMAFSVEFDAVFTNAALHWMRDPTRVLDAVARALRPGGRFVGEFGGHGNVAAIRTALAAVLTERGFAVASPWYFPTVEEFAKLLQSHGFAIDAIALVPRPTALPTGLRGWLDTFAHPFVARLDAAQRAEVLAAVTDLLSPILCDSEDNWTADYVRLRFSATLT